MDSSHLTREQCQAMHDAILPTLGYLSRLKSRMEANRWPADDLLLADVVKAQQAMQALRMNLHYLSCPPGTVGNPAKSPNVNESSVG